MSGAIPKACPRCGDTFLNLLKHLRTCRRGRKDPPRKPDNKATPYLTNHKRPNRR